MTIDPRDAIARLETLSLMDGKDLPARAIREQVSRAVDVIAVVTDLGGGERLVSHVSCVTGIDVDLIALEDVFVYEGQGEGGTDGRFKATGYVPPFYEELRKKGIVANRDIFRD